jgi:hypothetical protein
MRFKLSDDLKAREANFGNIDIGLEPRRQPDGLIAIPTAGTLVPLRFDPKRKCATGGAGGESDRDRPTITRRDDEATDLGARRGTGIDGLSAEERARAAGMQPTGGDTAVPDPGTSGPTLGAGTLRGLRRGDDVNARDGGPVAPGDAGAHGTAPPPPEPAPPPPGDGEAPAPTEPGAESGSPETGSEPESGSGQQPAAPGQ